MLASLLLIPLTFAGLVSMLTSVRSWLQLLESRCLLPCSLKPLLSLPVPVWPNRNILQTCETSEPLVAQPMQMQKGIYDCRAASHSRSCQTVNPTLCPQLHTSKPGPTERRCQLPSFSGSESHCLFESTPPHTTGSPVLPVPFSLHQRREEGWSEPPLQAVTIKPIQSPVICMQLLTRQRTHNLSLSPGIAGDCHMAVKMAASSPWALPGREQVIDEGHGFFCLALASLCKRLQKRPELKEEVE